MAKARFLWIVPLLALGFATLVSGDAGAGSSAQTSDLERAGRDLFLSGCASCHGAGAGGTADGPSLLEVGAAAVDFQLRTGRMPLADPGNQATRKPPAFDPTERTAIVAYLATVIEGPAIPEVSLLGADLSNGHRLFVGNCAACHGATANGGAVGGEAIAPSLFEAEPIEIAEAIVSGPGEMPPFGFDARERSDIISFVRFLQEERAPGGADIGGVGPVPEGFVAWMLGTSAMTIVAVLLTWKRRRAGIGPHEDDAG